MVKCKICTEKIDETFLGKIIGTYFKKDGKTHPVCSQCQKKLSKDELYENL